MTAAAGVASFVNAYLANRYAKLVLDHKPIAYWRLGESSGTTAADASGNGNNGTYTGGVTLGAAGALVRDPDTAAAFDGVDDRVVITNPTSLDVAQVSVEAWVRPTLLSDLGGIFEKSVGGAVNSKYLLFQEGRNWRWRVKPAATGFVTVSVPVSAARVTVHLVGTYDGSQIRLYKDGTLVDGPTAAGALATGDGDAHIGHKFSGVYPFYGTIDEVAVYDYALSPEQIASHYTMGTVLGGIRMTSGIDVAAETLTFVHAAVAIAMSSTMSVAAGVATFVNAAVTIAIETTMTIAARIRSYLINPSKVLRIVGIRHDPKTDRVTLDTEEV